MIIVLLFATLAIFGQRRDPLPPAESSNTYNIKVLATESIDDIVDDIKDIAKIKGFKISGEFHTSGHHLRNDHPPSPREIEIPTGNKTNWIDVNLKEGLTLIRDNPGLLWEGRQFAFKGSIYDRDGQGDEYNMNRYPGIVVNLKERIIHLTTSNPQDDINPNDYYDYEAVLPDYKTTTEYTQSKIVREDEIYEDYLKFGTLTEFYSLGQGDYFAQGRIFVGYNFASNWTVGVRAYWKNRNDEDTGVTYTQQIGIVRGEISDASSLVGIGIGYNRYIIDDQTTQEIGIAFPVELDGSWIPHQKIRLNGGIEYNIPRDRQNEPFPPSTASGEIRYSPIDWDLLNNGHTNNYGLGAKVDLDIDREVALKNLSFFVFLGNALINVRAPNKEVTLGINYNEETKTTEYRLRLVFEIGVQ